MSYSSWVISFLGKKDSVFPNHKSELFGQIEPILVMSPNPYILPRTEWLILLPVCLCSSCSLSIIFSLQDLFVLRYKSLVLLDKLLLCSSISVPHPLIVTVQQSLSRRMDKADSSEFPVRTWGSHWCLRVVFISWGHLLTNSPLPYFSIPVG